jgi:Ran GTPase-activating protein 1
MAALTELRMPQNGIRPEGIDVLVRALADRPSLEVLDLQDNTFTEVGSRALAHALPHWPRLRFLNVGDCLLSAKVRPRWGGPRGRGGGGGG